MPALRWMWMSFMFRAVSSTKARAGSACGPRPMGRAYRYQRRTAHIVVAVAEHHRAAAERTAAAVAAAASEKGVRGAVKKARKALGGGKQAPGRKPKKQE